jgi:hypothetical protein
VAAINVWGTGLRNAISLPTYTACNERAFHPIQASGRSGEPDSEFASTAVVYQGRRKRVLGGVINEYHAQPDHSDYPQLTRVLNRVVARHTGSWSRCRLADEGQDRRYQFLGDRHEPDYEANRQRGGL